MQDFIPRHVRADSVATNLRLNGTKYPMDEFQFYPFLANAQGQMGHPKAKLLASVLSNYDIRTVVAQVAGLATVPRFQANSYRIEFLSQLAVACCDGNKRPTSQHLDHWLNRHLGVLDIAHLEDPPEDTFVVNVVTAEGDFRVLGGLWEAADSATTLLIETLAKIGGHTQRAWLRPALSLLQLSDAMLERAGLTRWQTEPSNPKGKIPIVPVKLLTLWARHTTFHADELTTMGVCHAELEPFVFDLTKRKKLLDQSNQESDLHRRPLLRFGDEYVIALPNALTYAIRRYLLDCAANAHQIGQLQSALMMRVQRRLFQIVRHGSRHRMEVVKVPIEVGGVQGICQSIVVQVGTRRFLHFLVVADDLRQMALTGFLTPSQLSSPDETKLREHVDKLRDYLESTYEIDSAHTLWLMGYLGQAFIGNPPDERPIWTFETARLNDLEMLFHDPDDPVDRLILLLNQGKQFQREGLDIPFQNGLLNFYRFWIKQDFCLRIADMPHDQNAYLQIGTDFVAGYRADRREAVDEHCEMTLSDGWVIVQRSNAAAVYESLRLVPAYVSLDHLSRGVLSFCLKQHDTIVWLTFVAPNDGAVRESTFKLWEALQLLLHKLLVRQAHVLRFKFEVVEVTIDFQHVTPQTGSSEGANEDYNLLIIQEQLVQAIRLVAGAHFLENFNKVENQGEQLLLTQLIRALVMLTDTVEARVLDPVEEAMSILGGANARVLHTFRMHYDVEYLLAAAPKPVYRSPTEHMKFASGTAFTWRPSISKSATLEKDASIDALNTAVSRQVERLLSLLKRFDRARLIPELLHMHETLLRDKTRWRSTARAVRALYGADDGTRAAGEIERGRAQLQVTIRALVEAAICECPTTSGVAPDEYSLDELVGTMVTLIDLGRDSDTVYYGFATKGITLYPNGSYSINADILAQFARPYVAESFEKGYVAAAADYERWVGLGKAEATEKAESVFDLSNFLEAWQAEYGHSFSAFQEIAGELQDLAVKQGAVIVETTIEELAAARKGAGVTLSDVEAFVDSFGLSARTTWIAQPPESLPKDVYPWRFQRRLSLILRPLVVCQKTNPRQLIYGVGTLRESLGYILDSIRCATFDKDVFRSKAMRSFLGARVDLLGAQFAHRVAAALIDRGWQTATEVKLTQFGAPKTPNLGDVDVLAWHPDGRVLAIECKRLKQSKTIAEMAQACMRFQGNAGDHMFKHLRRGDWLRTHIAQISMFTGLSADLIRVRYPMVVSTPVPFKYLHGLPMQASDVVSFDALEFYL